jgi:hypothetical protein
MDGGGRKASEMDTKYEKGVMLGKGTFATVYKATEKEVGVTLHVSAPPCACCLLGDTKGALAAGCAPLSRLVACWSIQAAAHRLSSGWGCQT